MADIGRLSDALRLRIMEWFTRLRRWWDALPGLGRATAHTLVYDVMLTVGLMTLITLMATSIDSGPGLLFNSTTAITVLWSLPAAIPLVLRRVWPEYAAWMYVALTLAHLIFGPAIVFSDFFAPIMLYSVLLYGKAAHTIRFVTAACATTVFAGLVWGVAFMLGPMFPAAPRSLKVDWESWLPHALFLPACPGYDSTAQSMRYGCGAAVAIEGGTGAAAIGVCMVSVIIMAFWQRARRTTLDAMRQRNEALEARKAEEARIAALAERARIARDMHDVVAHTLSTIIVQADGGRYAGANDITVARTTMATIRSEATRAQHDMRRLFDVFGTAETPQGYADIPILLNKSFNASMHVSRTVSGTVQEERLPDHAGEALFRVVQEGLTNARKYAGAGAHVRIDESWTPTDVTIAITDDGRGAQATEDGHAPGYGLMGMRERIEALGGNVTAGPRPNGGFALNAVVPLQTGIIGTDSSNGEDSPIGSGSPARADGSDRLAGTDTRHTASDSLDRDIDSRLPRWSRRFIQWLKRTAASLRSRSFDQGDVSDLNWIGRLARWTQRHYLLMDILGTVILVVLFHSSTYYDLQVLANDGIWDPAEHTLATLLTIVLLAPLAFRRRFPETSALVVALLSGMQLLLPPSIMSNAALAVNVFALVSVYSAVLYGREQAWRWVSVALVADSWLYGIKLMAGRSGTSTVRVLAQMVMPDRYSSEIWTIVFGGLAPGGMVMLAGFACIASARWVRSRGANALVLQQREEALRAEQERQKVLAANLERERIGAAMQAEVLATLESVIAQTAEGIATLNSSPAPDGMQIAALFTAIGARGRAALAHMRELLTVLRETGFSDEQHAGSPAPLQLRPLGSVDDQLLQRQQAQTKHADMNDIR